MSFNSMQWFDHSVLIWIGISLALNIFVSYLWHRKFYLKLGLENYQAIQRIHINETPRLGGLIILISLIGYIISCEANESIQLFKLILVCLAPIIVIGLKEDLFHNVKPVIRLLSLFFVGCLFITKYTDHLPILTDVPFIGKLLLFEGGVNFFYILSMAAIANGMNMTDGVNGLCGAISLSILSALLFLCYQTNDTLILSLIFNLILFLIPFLIMNYPYGRIFLGDLGAYSLGLILAMFTIIFFGRHPEISPWGGVLILIYPAIEVVLSLLRRFASGISVFKPDTAHLHLKLYNFFKLQTTHKKMANSLVMPTLGVLWLFPLIAVTFTYKKPDFILISILLFIIIYAIIYLAIPKIHVKKYTST